MLLLLLNIALCINSRVRVSALIAAKRKSLRSVRLPLNALPNNTTRFTLRLDYPDADYVDILSD